MTKMLTPCDKGPSIPPTVPQKTGGIGSAILPSVSVEEVETLFRFHELNGTKLDRELRDAKKAVEQCERELSAAQRAYREISSSTGRDGMKKTRNLSIIVSAGGGKHAGEIVLRVTYNVSEASWSPSYDLRVTSSGPKAEASASPLATQQAMQLSYYGLITQSSGEDWQTCKIALSTATPSVGGTPPAPPTRTVRYCNPSGPILRSNYDSKGPRRGGGGGGGGGGIQSKGMNVNVIPQQALMAAPMRRLSINANELDSSESDGDGDRSKSGSAAVETSVETSGAGSGSSTFNIERRTTIASDSKEHKVCIGIIELQPELRHFTTPGLEETAYLQVRTVNSSVYPLLASNMASVFFDGSYVCKTTLKAIYPGESFSVFLGTDPGVKVTHKLVKKSVNEGKEGSFMTKSTDSKQVFEYLTQIHNTKPADKIDITVVEILPRSRNEKIVVSVLEPPESAFVSSTSGSQAAAVSSSSSSGEGQLKPGKVVRNKITNNVVFSKSVAPQEKLEIPFSYSITWEHEKSVEII